MPLPETDIPLASHNPNVRDMDGQKMLRIGFVEVWAPADVALDASTPLHLDCQLPNPGALKLSPLQIGKWFMQTAGAVVSKTIMTMMKKQDQKIVVATQMPN